MKTILIIGSSGFIGKKLNKKLNKKFKLIYANKSNGFDISRSKNFNKINKKKIDIIINLSGQIKKSKKEMYKTIVKGNQNIIDFVQENKKITLVYFISSSLVYGFSKYLKRESSNINPILHYAKYKAMAEKKYFKSNIDYNIIRLCSVYSFKNENIIKKLIHSFLEKKKINITNVEASRNYIHINDLVEIIYKLLLKKINKKIYNIGHENLKIIDIIKKIEKISKKKFTYYNQNINLKKLSSQKINVSRIFKEINFKPKIKINHFIQNQFANES